MLAKLKVRNAGQVCVSPTRVLVQERVYDQFVTDFIQGGAGALQRLDLGGAAAVRRGPAPGRVLHLDLDGTGRASISTGVGFYDHMLTSRFDAATFAGHETVAITVSEPVSEILLNAAEGIEPRPDWRLWTDDFNNIFQVLKSREGS